MPAALLPFAWSSDHPLLAVLVGLVGLVAGADLLVRGSVWIALTLGMSRMAVGLTLVAMGTSLPELLVTLTAARTGRSEIAMANVIGSNTANVLLIVGVTATICAIRLQVRWYELVYMLIATALAAVPFVLNGEVSRPLSAAMVVMLCLFCVGLLRRERTREEHPGHEKPPRATPVGWLLHLALLGGGFVLLAYSAEWLVDGAVAIAGSLGMSEAVIGMTIVAIGTSLPELATSAVAAKKGQPEIAIGNVIGSNIFNVGSVLGIAGLLQPFPVETGALGRLMIVTGGSALLLVLVLRLCGGVPRWAGLLFVLAYAGFLTFEVLHGAPA